jgi:hypothetical protein
MKELPTAEQLLENYHFKAGEHVTNSDYDLMCEYAIEFAKLHVEAALEAAVNSARTEAIPRPPTDSIIIVVNKDSILNSYPLTNIK